MTVVSWSRCGDDDCIRVSRATADATVQVRAGAIAAYHLPPMAGRVVAEDGDLCFVPRFAFVDGTTYTVAVDGVTAAVLVRPRPDVPATTDVLEILPTATEVPRNFLRFYICFSASMAEGYAAEHVRLLDDAGEPMVGALLPTEHELWDGDRRRLTVLLDPARIKRGLVGHRQIGYPLQPGGSFRVVVDIGFRDAQNVPLRGGAERRYAVTEDVRSHVEPQRWTLTVPPSHTVEPLVVAFDRPLDHGLLGHCLQVIGPGGRRVVGTADAGPEERSWWFAPAEDWMPGAHELVVDPVLEDLAGNSVRRVFDRDLTHREDDPQGDRPIRVAFRPTRVRLPPPT
jgi:hypothetical protein